MKRIALLGSTGSIGTQTLEIVSEYSDQFEVVAISANKSVKKVYEQILAYKPKLVCMYDENAYNELRELVKDIDVELTYGMEGLMEVATYPSADMVVTAVVGMIGIRPTIAAIKAKKDIALANKETLVTAGHIIIPLVKEMEVKLLPVDSEHSAIFQSLQGLPYYDGSTIADGNKAIKNIILTASGGPFRGLTLDEMKNKTRHDALKHPNWAMGAKITIDSSTLVNKGLEMMEAGWLFGVNRSQIKVVIHPESILHSGVEFVDGAIVGQMGAPDMKLPILYAMMYPDRKPLHNPIDFYEIGKMTFLKPDKVNFPGLRLAEDAMELGGSMPTVYNAANEFLVAKFLKDEIGYLDIANYIEDAMNHHQVVNNPSLEEILDIETKTYNYLGSALKTR